MTIAQARVRAPFAEVLHNVELLRLNFGVLVLHATQTALFLVVLRILEAGGLAVASHWKAYLPVMGLSFVMMVPAIVAAEKRGKIKFVLLSAIALILIGQLLLGVAPHTILSVAAVLFVYFLGFNILDASQPSLVSKLAPGTRKGAAGVTRQRADRSCAGRGGRRLVAEGGRSERCVLHLFGAGLLLAYTRQQEKLRSLITTLNIDLSSM